MKKRKRAANGYHPPSRLASYAVFSAGFFEQPKSGGCGFHGPSCFRTKRLAANVPESSLAIVVHPSDTFSEQTPAGSSWRLCFWPVSLLALIFFASSKSEVAAPPVIGIDKIGHFVVYAWLGVLLARNPVIAQLRPFGVWSAVLIASLYGLTDEFHQSFTPGRSVEVADWIVDTVGAFTSVAVYSRWAGLRRWLEGFPSASIR